MSNRLSSAAHGHARLCVALFYALLFLVGLVVSGDYGLPCDEPAEQVILRENLKEYAYQLMGADSEAVRYYGEMGIQRISESIERDHGQCAYYLAAPLLTIQPSRPDLFTLLWHSYTWLWFMAGVLAIYGFGRDMGWSRPIAAGASLLLYLAPRFFAEGHYNNKDVVLLSLCLITLWLGLRFLKRPGFLRGLLLSLAGAMAANTKVVGILGWGLIGGGAALLITVRREWNLRMALVALSTILGFLAMYALLTPALWPDPAGYFVHALQNASGFTRWPGVVMFRGMVFEHAVNPLPRYYLPFMMLATLPLYTLPLAAVGQLTAIGAAIKQKAAFWREPKALAFLCCTLFWLLPLGYALLAQPLVYNGWRHFYFVYAGIALLAGQGLHWLSGKLERRRFGRRVLGLAACLCFVGTAWGIAANHPYQYGYYNLLVRENAANRMELDYWDVSTVNAMKTLCQAERNESLPLALGSRDDMSWFGVEHGHAVLPAYYREKLSIAYDENAPYLFFNTTYALIYGVPPPEGYHVLFQIESYGNTLCILYEKDQ